MAARDPEMIGEYQLLRLIGRGGMGAVYLARDKNLGRYAALKLMNAVIAGDQGYLTRFRQEAQRLAQLSHPFIVHLYGFGEHEGQLWMAMQFVASSFEDDGQPEGMDLGRKLRMGISDAEMLNVLRNIAKALDYIHARGVVHRDLKPGNILLDHSGEAYLADFGLAKLYQGSAPSSAAMGTPDYMSPEQCVARLVGPPTDVYALGVIAYQWLAKRLPFEGDTPVAIAMQHVQVAMPEGPLSHLPVAAVEALRKAMHKDPDERFGKASGFVEALAVGLMAPAAVVPAPVAATALPSTTQTASGIAKPAEPGQSGRLRTGGRGGYWLGVTGGALAVTLMILWPKAKNPPADAGPGVSVEQPEATSDPSRIPLRASAGEIVDKAESPAAPESVVDLRKPGAVFRDKLKDGSEGPEMVVVPAGSFLMGTPDAELEKYSNEGPQHKVALGRFALGRTEVSVAQFRKFAAATGYVTDAESDRQLPTNEMGRIGCYLFTSAGARQDKSWKAPGFTQGDDHPAVCLSWNDAKAYADWISKETGKTYRLPSEAQLEYAIRAGTQTPYPWGPGNQPACEYANILDQSAADPERGIQSEFDCTDGFVHTMPVGSLRANDFGLFDIIGNASEWSLDCRNWGYVGAPTDGSPWLEGECERRVHRGGSYGSSPYWSRSARRLDEDRSGRDPSTGMRISRVL